MYSAESTEATGQCGGASSTESEESGDDAPGTNLARIPEESGHDAPMWRAGWGDADGAGASAPTGARWESLQEEENQALFARSPLFPSSPVTTNLTRGRKRGQDVDNSPRPKSARSSSSDDLPPCDADVNVSAHAEGQHYLQPPGSWTGNYRFHDEEIQRAAGVALAEGQDGSGHPLVNADGSLHTTADTSPTQLPTPASAAESIAAEALAPNEFDC